MGDKTDEGTLFERNTLLSASQRHAVSKMRSVSSKLEMPLGGGVVVKYLFEKLKSGGRQEEAITDCIVIGTSLVMCSIFVHRTSINQSINDRNKLHLVPENGKWAGCVSVSHREK